MKTTPCKGCGKPIIWGETLDGKRIPLDPRPPVYSCAEDVSPGANGRVIAGRMVGVAVTHFATCPRASDFSKGRNKGES